MTDYISVARRGRLIALNSYETGALRCFRETDPQSHREAGREGLHRRPPMFQHSAATEDLTGFSDAPAAQSVLQLAARDMVTVTPALAMA
nr:hypothetical protein [uncultured Celeribacter sp.]